MKSKINVLIPQDLVKLSINEDYYETNDKSLIPLYFQHNPDGICSYGNECFVFVGKEDIRYKIPIYFNIENDTFIVDLYFPHLKHSEHRLLFSSLLNVKWVIDEVSKKMKVNKLRVYGSSKIPEGQEKCLISDNNLVLETHSESENRKQINYDLDVNCRFLVFKK